MSTEPGLPTLFAQAAKLPLLTPRQEVELASRRDAGDPNAVRRMVEHNIRLSIWRAKRWTDRGLPYEDLVQEGVFGLERAARKYDPSKGVRFSTYAIRWVDHFMQKAVAHEDIVPYSVRTRRQKASRLISEGRTVDEVARSLGCSPPEVVEALESSQVAASLDDESDLHERLASPEDDDDTGARVREAVLSLPEPERELIELRYGLDPHDPHSRSEAAKRLGLTSREASALEAKATDALRVLLSDYEHEAGMHECINLGPEEMDVICER